MTERRETLDKRAKKMQMDLHILKNITGGVLLFAILVKVLINIYLDYKKTNSFDIISIVINPLRFLRPFKISIQSNLNILQRIGNIALIIFWVATSANLATGIMQSINYFK